jgi:hypothetical protein
LYSGYLPVGAASGVPGQIHCWLIKSEGNPATDPVVYWINGGPGGSGISTGLLNELGQVQHYELSTATGGVPQLQYYLGRGLGSWNCMHV